MTDSTRPQRAISPRLLLVAGLFVATLVTSNIIAVKLTALGPFTVPAAIVIFPLAYLFGDVLTEVWGYATARMVIWTGFAANIVVVCFIAIAVAVPSSPAYPNGDAYSAILGMTPRIVIASLVAYLCGEFVNSFILARLKIATRGRFLWTRTIGSTLIGQGLDTVIFISIAFAGVLPFPVLRAVMRDQWILKVLYEIVATPLTYAIVAWLKRREGVDAYDHHTNFNPVPLSALRSWVGGIAR
ncbi:MAG TPA: queuosine precursor transporter [Candidatus Dormibacteraeota bacterium]|nr:queuosine precursor transporter [Candidatus Dormibacteraeota bacterium]